MKRKLVIEVNLIEEISLESAGNEDDIINITRKLNEDFLNIKF